MRTRLALGEQGTRMNACMLLLDTAILPCWKKYGIHIGIMGISGMTG